LKNYNKRSKIHVIVVPEGEEKEAKPEKVFKETVTEKFPNL